MRRIYITEDLKVLDEALDFLNETFKDVREGGPYGKGMGELKRLVKNILKKKKKEDKEKYKGKEQKVSQLTPKEKERLQKEYDEDYAELLKTLKLCVKKVQAEKDYKDKCAESCIRANKMLVESDQLKAGYLPKLSVDDSDGDCYIIIIDDYQVVAIAYSWILHEVVNILEKDYKSVSDKWDFHYGDGDEGCLYPEYMGR